MLGSASVQRTAALLRRWFCPTPPVPDPDAADPDVTQDLAPLVGRLRAPDIDALDAARAYIEGAAVRAGAYIVYNPSERGVIVVGDADVPKDEVQVLHPTQGTLIRNLAPVEPDPPDACPNCGAVLTVGSWPFCPHGTQVAYGFTGNFR